jgi:hypothetical protein
MHQEDPHMYAEATRPERTARAGALMSGRNRKFTATPCAGDAEMRFLSDAAEERGDICRRSLATPATGAHTAPRRACAREPSAAAVCSPSELEACIASLPGPHVVTVYDGHGAAWWCALPGSAQKGRAAVRAIRRQPRGSSWAWLNQMRPQRRELLTQL